MSDVDIGSLGLAELAGVAAGCTLCPLSDGRTNVVFGTGDPNADLMFVGEGPGAEEDKQGLPFVGRSGSCWTSCWRRRSASTARLCTSPTW